MQTRPMTLQVKILSQQIPTLADSLPTHQEYEGNVRFIQFRLKKKKKSTCPLALNKIFPDPLSSHFPRFQSPTVMDIITYIFLGLAPQRWWVYNQGFLDMACFI